MLNAKDAARVFDCLCIRAEGKPIEKTRLLKLLYFVQGHAMAELGHELFSNQIDAWDYGPVVAVVYTNYEKINQLALERGISDIAITPDEMDMILDVWEQYHTYNAKELVSLTHESGTPWSEVYQPGIKNAQIPSELMKQYFARPENRLKRLTNVEKLSAVDALPAEEYDPDEDAVWEAMLHDAR